MLIRPTLTAASFAAALASSTMADARPNIILLLTDDQKTESYAYMPFLQSIAPLGRVFTKHTQTMALCAPSRASMLTGMYPHNHGVVGGGYDSFLANGQHARTWGQLLQNDGYYTALLGKFINGYSERGAKPPGWDDWFSYLYTPVQGENVSQYNYEMNDNGVVKAFGETDADHLEIQIRRAARRAIARAGTYQKPFAMLIASKCPHGGAEPTRQYLGLYETEPVLSFAKPSFDEEDVEGKPQYVQDLGRITQGNRDKIASHWRRGLECLRAVDDTLRAIWQDLAASGQLANTYIFITTDNGFMGGEHRIHNGKVVSYLESIRSNLYTFGPGVVPGQDTTNVTANIDFMATFSAIAGLPTPSWSDGRNMLPLMQNQSVPWRNYLLVRGSDGSESMTGDPDPRGRRFLTLAGSGLTYTRYAGSVERELYDLTSDPYQLNNIAASLGESPQEDAVADALFTCTGQECRDLEDQLP